MINPIIPCLWFDGKAKAAAAFYGTIFPNSKLLSHNPMVTRWELFGQEFMGIDGGPMFKPNPSISFFVNCESKEEAESYWDKLSPEANILMAFGKYPWSELYGFLQDQFGISWQVLVVNPTQNLNKQKIVPSMMFVGDNFGKASEAIKFYTSVFKHSSELDPAQFLLDGNGFKAIDSPGNHAFTFNEGISFVVNCHTQEQIDYYWNTFTKDGGKESRCGWCKDKFGVSWQIVPSMLGQLMNDPARRQKVMEAFMKMNKFDIQTLQNA